MLALMPLLASAQTQEVTIGSKADWDAFAARVNAGETSLNASMIANVIEGVTTMVGTENNPYGGTFNGNGFTLTLALSGDGQFLAPFSRVSGATIENLKTTGTVTANEFHASGLVGSNDGGFTARNCWVDANISGSAHSGGLLGHGRSAPFTMENCLFSGGNDAEYNAGGLVAWDDDSTPTISNCLNAGTFSYDGFAPIARVGGRGTITNCYYTTATTCSGDLNDDRGTFTDKTGYELAALLGNGWGLIEDEVVPAVFGVYATMKYGDAVPSLENLLSGIFQDVLSISTSATPYSPVGGYPIRITRGSGDNIYNYTNGMLKIEKAPLKVTAKSYTIQQGDPLPAFEATYSGFKNKQTASVLTKQPVFTTISSSAVPGVYDIEVSDAEAENYEFTYVKGKLTIEDIGCEAYANLVNDVLTFRFDAQRSTCAGRTYSLNTGETSPGWKNSLSGVKKVVFDTSFAQARPTSTYSWFDSADKLETIEGWENLNTSEVTSMANMFQKCRMLESIDVSGWDTGNVENMANMFSYCTKLGNLNLSNWNTSKVMNMTNMFSYCSSLTNIDLSGWNTKMVKRMNGMFASCTVLTTLEIKHFDTQNVTDMSRMFYNCRGLNNINVIEWNTGKVTTMKEMFAGCSNMKSINMQGLNTKKVKDMSYLFANCTSLEFLILQDCETFAATDMNHMFSGCISFKQLVLNSFDTFSVTDMSYMFANCSNLEAINVGEYWDTESVSNSEGMFENCSNLTGGQGTAYDADYTDKDYARIDGGSATPGYLSGKAEAYVVLDNDVLTFFFDGNKNCQTSTVYELNAEDQDPAWCDKVTVFIIDPSFCNYLPVCTRMWFKNADQIVGLEYLNTENVSDMNYMFWRCSMTSLDVSRFKTSNVTKMNGMFAGCGNLTSLDLSSFDTSNVTGMVQMFWCCSSLTSLDLSRFNTAKVQFMGEMFSFCSSLVSLDVSSFDTSNTMEMWMMFFACSSLTYLDLSSFDFSNVGFRSVGGHDVVYEKIVNNSYLRDYSIDGMGRFVENCTSLTCLDLSGCNSPSNKLLSKYHSSQIIIADNPSLSTIILNGANGQIIKAFNNLENLKVVKLNDAQLPQEDMTRLFSGFTNLTTVEMNRCKVKNMNFAFEDCINLTTVEMDGCNVEDMSSAFKGCSNLQKVIMPSSPINMSSTFEGCTSLQSIDLSSLNQSQITSMNSAFKGCSNLQTVIMPSSDNKNLTNMSSVFEGCTRLQSLDLSSFELSHVTNTANMFSGCRRLQTIYSNQTVTAENSEGMFTDCIRLTGGKGTTLDDDHLDAFYACVDGGNSTPGYFTAKATPYVMMDDQQMTFYYDTKNFSRQSEGYTRYALHDMDTQQEWTDRGSITFVDNVIFDSSFASYQPQSTAGWFAGAQFLKTFSGLENLKTNNVENMNGMFEDCYSLNSLDLSGFSTNNVTDMTDLFKNCYSLSTLDLSEWTLSNTNPMESLRECPSLTTLTMNNVWMPTNMSGMFKDMSSLTTLNLSGSLTDAITDLSELFYGCSNLTNLNLADCNTSNVVNMSQMFRNCTSIENVNIIGMNTGNVLDMSGMFSGCTSLQKLNVSGWDLSNVTTTEDMFNGCSSLRRIICDDSWDASNVGTSTSMFEGCTSLIGSQGTIYDAAYTDKTYARIDGGNSAPGYLADKEPGIATDIKTVSREAAPEGVYSLDGQKLNKKPTKKGVYIINGRKVVVK